MGTIVDSVAGTPMCSVAQEVERVGGIEEEFFFEGTATQFVLAAGADEYPTRRTLERGTSTRAAVPHSDARGAPPESR